MSKVYVSITGLRVKTPFHAPLFWWHALRSMGQAQRAPGNLSTAAKTLDGVHHTLTVWESRVAARDYVRTGVHARAVAAFRRIATGKTYGYLADRAPDWSEAQSIWREKGREY